MKIQKPTPLYLRLADPSFLQLPKYPHSDSETVQVNETVFENDRPVSRVVLKTIKLTKKFQGLKVTDFCLESVIAAGADSTLVPVSISASSPLSDSDNLDRLASSLKDSDIFSEKDSSPSESPVVSPSSNIQTSSENG